MFIVNCDQIEAFRIPMREEARDKLIADMADDNIRVSADKNTIVHIDEAGSETTLVYSADVLPTTIIKASGTRYEMDYDDQGRLSQLTYPDGKQLGFKFDQGQLQQVGTSVNKTFKFDYDKGKLSRVVYPGQKGQRFLYNDFGELTGVVDRTGHTHKFIRTPNGQLQAIKDPLNRSVQFVYDEDGLLSDLVFPDRTRQSYQYDEDNDTLNLKLRDGKQFSQVYDGELINQLSWEQGPTIQFKYNRENQPTQIGNNSAQVDFTYDEKGRLSVESNPYGQTDFAYDDVSRLTRLTLTTGLRVGYIYDSESRVVGLQVDGQTVQFVYEQDLLAEIRYSGGITEYQTRSHTEGLKHVRIKNSQGELLSEQRYSYDNWDRLTGYQDIFHTKNIQLAYDDESRLTGLTDAQSKRSIEHFAYDAKGNLSSLNGHPVVIGQMDEVRQIGRMSVQYDALGNVISLGGPRGRLNLSFERNSTLSVAITQSGTWQYEYDGVGRRISKTNGKQRWRFVWAGSQLVAEFYESAPGAAEVVRDYIYLPDSQVPVAFREANELFWLQADVRGAITHVFDGNGQVVWHGSYSAFGEVTVLQSKIRQPWRLMGQYEDDETGLYYNLARYYCPWLTTYLSLDPEWLDPETYYYSYARNDPYNRADPLGNIAPLLAVALVGAAVGGVISGVVKAAEGGSFREVVGAVAHGALTGVGAAVGGIIGLAGGPLLGYVGMALGTGLGGFLGSLAERAINGENIFTKCALQKALLDAAEEMAYAVALGVVGKVLSLALKPLANRIASSKLGQTGLNIIKKAVTQVKVARLRSGVLLGGKPIHRILPGRPDKVAMIGRDMKIVEAAKKDFDHFDGIELFNPASQRKNIFLIDGKKYKWADLVRDLSDQTKYLPRVPGPDGKEMFVATERLPETLMFKANKQWAEKLKKEGYTIIDMGSPAGAKPSPFYNIEIEVLF